MSDVGIECGDGALELSRIVSEGLDAVLCDEIRDISSDVAWDEGFDARQDIGGGEFFVVEAEQAGNEHGDIIGGEHDEWESAEFAVEQSGRHMEEAFGFGGA